MSQKDEPPQPDDEDGWRRVVAEGRLKALPEAKVVEAIQTLMLDREHDQRLIEDLVHPISERMHRTIRGGVSRSRFADEGRQIVEDTHAAMLEALLSPDSADGKGLRTRFFGTLRNRTTDVVRKALLEMKRYPSMDQPGVLPDTTPSPFTDCEQEAHVRLILDKIRGDDKRKAFELHMEGLPYGGEKGDSIAARLGVSVDTATAWVKDAKAQLAKLIGKTR